MSKFNNKYIKKSDRDVLSEILTLIKNRKHYSALKLSLSFMDKNDRLKFTVDLVSKSKYKAYFGGLSEFQEIIDSYLYSKDLGRIKVFLAELEKRASESNSVVNSFYLIRSNILLDLLNDNGQSTFDAILILHNYDILFGEEDNDKFLPLIVDICRINWPDNPAIKVLFGKV